MPSWASALRPDWVALVLIYWCLALPQRVGMGIAFILGITLDVLMGSLLGQHALALVTIVYLTLELHQRLRVFPLWQQALSILALLILNQFLLLWVSGISGHPVRSWVYWAPALSGMLMWPWIYLVLRGSRRHFRVA